LGYHGSDIGASSEETAMIENRILGANANLFVQLHGAVMVIAWVMTSSLGIFVARYYKQTHTDFNPFNKAFWFVVSFILYNHRTCAMNQLLYLFFSCL